MKPEAVASRLVAAENRSILWQTEPFLGGLDLLEQRHRAARPDRLEPGLLAQSDGEGQLPLAQAEIESQVEHRGVGNGTIGTVSRCHGKAPGKSCDLPSNGAYLQRLTICPTPLHSV